MCEITHATELKCIQIYTDKANMSKDNTRGS
jgi:hypothetical protein